MSITFIGYKQESNGVWNYIEEAPSFHLSNARAFDLLRRVTEVRMPHFTPDYSGHLSFDEMKSIKTSIESHRTLYSFSSMEMPEDEIALLDLIKWVEERMHLGIVLGWG